VSAADAPLPAGLTSAVARQRLAEVGPNILVPRRRFEGLGEILGTLADPMALMLAAAAAVSFLLGEPRDGTVLLVALVPVLGVDVFLEARSRGALKALAASVAPRALVLRDGSEVEVPREELVPGDVLVLREGDDVPADGLVRLAANLSVDESQLTGESEPQEKTEGSELSAGSLIRSGHGFGEVTMTGAATRYGRIATLVAAVESEPTPLQRKTQRMVRRFVVVALAVAAAVFVLGLVRGLSVLTALLSAISLAMAAIPEEFPLVFTLFLSLGALRLSKKGVLVRRLASVETLGSTTVICTDKTGTLTTGRFQLHAHVPLGTGVSEEELLSASVLACEIHPADTLEQEIVAHAQEHGVDVPALRGAWTLVRDYDFDPAGKHMSHVYEGAAGGEARIVAKGALEGILEHCNASTEERRRAEAENASLAARGIRVLAVAGRRSASGTLSGPREADESGISILGLIGFSDALRPEVPAAIAECRAAGIDVKLVTGDHPLTALAIAEEAGIASHEVVTGDELASLSPEALAERADRAGVFARIRPEEKHAIVEALQRAGETVAMTGDGINDAPALRRADIGVAMGVRGTAAARAAADLVLLDDDFTALVATVREGRHIYLNIQRAFLYLLAFHVPIVGLALAAPLLGLPLLLMPVHLVWLELIVHPVSALVFEAEPAPAELMRRPPRRRDEPLLPKGLALPSIVSGLLLTLATLAVYVLRLPRGVPAARGAALTTLILGSVGLVFAERAQGRPWSTLAVPRNARFWLIMPVVVASVPAALYVPSLARLLQVSAIGVNDALLAVVLGIASVGWRAFGTPPFRGKRSRASSSSPFTPEN
jgi:P-type Ca2+ transporter type 2C